MGNCQAVDVASLVIQHPSGKQERMYSPVTAREVMKTNPGYYVSLIIPIPISSSGEENSDDNKTVRFTRIKLLRPSDTLVLGHAYRLVTTQDVMKVLRAKRHDKMKNKQPYSGEKLLKYREKQSTGCEAVPAKEKDQATKPDRRQQRSGSINLATGRPKSWQPSLQSISESGS